MRLYEILGSGGTVNEAKPVPPMTPERARKRAAKQRRIQQRQPDERPRHADRMRDLDQDAVEP